MPAAWAAAVAVAARRKLGDGGVVVRQPQRDHGVGQAPVGIRERVAAHWAAEQLGLLRARPASAARQGGDVTAAQAGWQRVQGGDGDAQGSAQLRGRR